MTGHIINAEGLNATIQMNPIVLPSSLSFIFISTESISVVHMPRSLSPASGRRRRTMELQW